MDASLLGWGAHVGSVMASGLWSPDQALMHINVLELETACPALRHFVHFLRGKHVLCTDNTTVACYLNKQGGVRSCSISQRSEQLLLWCNDQNILISAQYVPGKLNVFADALRRPHMVLQTEWSLVP